jgi:hypothetical protein
MLALTRKTGAAQQKAFKLFAAYLREYRANILESAGWSPCLSERGKSCEGTSVPRRDLHSALPVRSRVNAKQCPALLLQLP